MNLASGDELPLQFRVGNEGAFEALPLDRRQFAFQVVKEFFGRHPNLDLFGSRIFFFAQMKDDMNLEWTISSWHR